MALLVRKKITEEQQELLIEYMEAHRKLNTGKFNSSFTHTNYMKLWEDLALKLNSCDGARKTAANWRKSWHDMKRTVKDKYARIKLHRRKTGGGEATTEKLTPQQERILALMRPTVVTGHPLMKESAVAETVGSVEQQQDNNTTRSAAATLLNLIAAPHNLAVLADLNVLNPGDLFPSSPGPSTMNSTSGLTQNKDTDACHCPAREVQNEQVNLEDSFTTEPSTSSVASTKPAPSKKRKTSSAGTTEATKAAEVLSSFEERELQFRQREVEARELFVGESLAIMRESEQRKARAMENIALALASIASALQRR